MRGRHWEVAVLVLVRVNTVRNDAFVDLDVGLSLWYFGLYVACYIQLWCVTWFCVTQSVTRCDDTTGQVFRAKLNGITPVAIKHINIDDVMSPGYADERLHVDFINEALISCSIQGPCLLHFYGLFWMKPPSTSKPAGGSHPVVATEDDGDDTVLDYYMVSELCEGGDLRGQLYHVDDIGMIHDPKPRV